MKILIIEDEQELQDLISRYMKKEGHICEQALGYKEGLKKINNFCYDCAIIDLNLPDGDGLNLVKIIREEAATTSILVVSARDTVNDRITGLNAGADDYLVKPFNLSELNARMKAVLRRKTNQPNQEIVIDNLRINLDERSVIANGTLLQLTKKEYDILIYLVRNKNRVVTKDSIAEHLWGDYMDEAVSFDFIYAHVKNLRKKLADHGCEDLVKTVYGIGYKFSTH